MTWAEVWDTWLFGVDKFSRNKGSRHACGLVHVRDHMD